MCIITIGLAKWNSANFQELKSCPEIRYFILFGGRISSTRIQGKLAELCLTLTHQPGLTVLCHSRAFLPSDFCVFSEWKNPISNNFLEAEVS